MNKYLLSWLAPCRDRTGRVVEVPHHEFSEAMRALHTTANINSIRNGLRRSAIFALTWPRIQKRELVN